MKKRKLKPNWTPIRAGSSSWNTRGRRWFHRRAFMEALFTSRPILLPAAQGSIQTTLAAASTVRGVARLYALNYKTGAAVHDFSATVETDNAGNTVSLGKLDRSLEVGTAMPSSPVIAVLSGGARLFVGVEGGIASLPTIATQDMHRYYWNQVF